MIRLEESREKHLGDIYVCAHDDGGAAIALAPGLVLNADRSELYALAETLAYAVELVDRAAGLVEDE